MLPRTCISWVPVWHVAGKKGARLTACAQPDHSTKRPGSAGTLGETTALSGTRRTCSHFGGIRSSKEAPTCAPSGLATDMTELREVQNTGFVCVCTGARAYTFSALCCCPSFRLISNFKLMSWDIMSFKKFWRKQTLLAVILAGIRVCQGAVCYCEATVLTKYVCVVASVSLQESSKKRDLHMCVCVYLRKWMQ